MSCRPIALAVAVALLCACGKPSSATNAELASATPLANSDAGTGASTARFDAELASCRQSLASQFLANALKSCRLAELDAPPVSKAEVKKLLEEVEASKLVVAASEDKALLKPVPRSMLIEGTTLKLNYIQTRVGRDLTSNNFGSGSTSARADKGNVMMGFDIDIVSKEKDPLLPCFIIASRKKGDALLRIRGKAQYGFRRWDSYGSYLGNYDDRGNDFAMSDTVKFVLEAELPEATVKEEAIYLLAERLPTTHRKTARFERPPVSYTGACDRAVFGTRAEVEQHYVTVAWRRPGGG